MGLYIFFELKLKENPFKTLIHSRFDKDKDHD